MILSCQTHQYDCTITLFKQLPFDNTMDPVAYVRVLMSHVLLKKWIPCWWGHGHLLLSIENISILLSSFLDISLLNYFHQSPCSIIQSLLGNLLKHLTEVFTSLILDLKHPPSLFCSLLMTLVYMFLYGLANKKGVYWYFLFEQFLICG